MRTTGIHSRFRVHPGTPHPPSRGRRNPENHLKNGFVFFSRHTVVLGPCPG